MGRRALTIAGVFGGLIAAAVVAAGAYTALKAPPPTRANTNLQPENCTPGPCVNLQGYTLWISDVHVDNDLVHMTVKFQNSSTSTHASPEDLTLIDSERRSSIPISDVTGCNTWTRHEFSHGEIFGPIDICFRVTNTTPPWILQWSPDLGTFCCQTQIRLYPT
jgi:hypothetical protein